jgi:hypothetical protein
MQGKVRALHVLLLWGLGPSAEDELSLGELTRLDEAQVQDSHRRRRPPPSSTTTADASTHTASTTTTTDAASSTTPTRSIHFNAT